MLGVLVLAGLMGAMLWELRAAPTQVHTSLAPIDDGVEVVAIPTPIATLHPLWADAPTAAELAALIWPPLAAPASQPGLEPEPVLARGWEPLQNGRSWRIHLRPRQFWSDGVPLTARDVVFTYAALMEPEYAGPFREPLAVVQTLQAEGDQTLLFTLREPVADFPARLAVGILPMHAVLSTRRAADPRLDLLRIPGCGPYELAGWLPGGGAALAANRFAPRHSGPSRLELWVNTGG